MGTSTGTWNWELGMASVWYRLRPGDGKRSKADLHGGKLGVAGARAAVTLCLIIQECYEWVS
jgi:hypothetical protein